MKLRDSIPAYFMHELTVIALYKGWTFEGDVTDFLLSIPDEVDYATEMLYNLKNTAYTGLSIQDIIILVRTGIYTETATIFFTEMYAMLKERNVPPEENIFMSMHSGSSDYFTASMVYDLIENIDEI